MLHLRGRLVAGRNHALDEGGIHLPAAHGRDVVKERQEGVVVALRQRVDLVVVAAGAANREAEERLARRGDDVVEPVIAGLLPVGGLVVPDAETVVARGDEVVGRRIRQFVAG